MTDTPKKTPDTATIQWVGPPDQESSVFGPLVAGQRYQTSPEFAAYLSTTHPEHWRLVSPPARSVKE